MSEHKNLWAALLAFKTEAPSLPKDKTNPHFNSKFTSLDAIADRIDPLLVKHDLVWTTAPGHVDGRPVLNYQLAHAPSGETLAGQMPLLLDRENSQGLGSALSYSRRYAKTAVLDLVADEDDDGNAASRPAQRSQRQPGNGQPTAQPAQTTEMAASAKQRGLINAKAAEAGLDAAALADTIRKAAGSPIKMYESDEQARQDVNRLLDRLPGRLVNPVLEGIATHKNDTVAA